jgi:hypothetical protein
MKTLRLYIILVMTLFSSIASAASSSGVWSSNQGYYLVLMEQSTTGTVAAMAIAPSLDSGLALTGTRSGNIINLRSLTGSSSIAMTLNGQAYTGSLTTAGSRLPLSGNVLLAYAGSANDGIWQKSDGGNRYLASLSVMSSGVPIMLIVDLNIPVSGTSITYDVATGVVQSISSNPSFIGVSLVSGNTVTLSFKGGTPTTGTYKVTTASRPIITVDQFDVNRIFSFD